MSASTEVQRVRALAEVKNLVKPELLASHENSPERTIFPDAFQQSIWRLFKYSEPSSRDARDILAFMRDAVRPLRSQELLCMLALRTSTEEFESEALMDSERLTEITQGLMDIGHNNVAYFVHPWLKSYLARSAWARDFPDSNPVLAKLCVQYLSWGRFHGGPCTNKEHLDKRVSHSPLLDYASKYWSKHYSIALERGVPSRDGSLQELMLKFLRQDKLVSCARQLMVLPDPVWEYRNRRYVQNLSKDQVEERFSVLVNMSTKARQPGHVDLYCAGHTTGLHLATLLNQPELVKRLLVEKPSAINELDDGGETLLHLALVHSSDDLVNFLVSKGADLSCCDHGGLSPWHFATAHGKVHAVEAMLKHPERKLEVNAPIQPQLERWQRQLFIPRNSRTQKPRVWIEKALSKSTAMHLAVHNNHIGVVRQIAQDPRFRHDAEDADGMTAFHKACKYGQIEMVKLFEAAQKTCSTHASTRDGRIGFHLACKYKAGHEVAKYLLEAVPNICELKDKHGEAGIHHAAAGECTETVVMLLQHSTLGVNSRNIWNETPLVLAARAGNHRTFEYLDAQPEVEKNIELCGWSVARYRANRT